MTTPDERDTQAGVLGMFLGSLGAKNPPKPTGDIRREEEGGGLVVTMKVGRHGMYYELDLQVVGARKL